jgi:nucleoside-diphosphate-sugar epimerase
MKALVSGGAGFIGSHLVNALVARGDEVTYVDNLVGGTRHRNDGAQFIFASIEDWANPARLYGFEVVFHLAASKATVCRDDPERDLRTNALGTLRLARAAAATGCTFVHASTGSVADVQSFYGASKQAGEAYVRIVATETGMPWTTLRYHHVIGPRQSDAETGGVVPIFLRRVREGLPLIVHGTGAQIRSFTSVHDVVRATLAVAETPQRAVLDCVAGRGP